nr:MAG TPA_asm: hypothetical protein [Caudoviricetes sp.]
MKVCFEREADIEADFYIGTDDGIWLLNVLQMLAWVRLE